MNSSFAMQADVAALVASVPDKIKRLQACALSKDHSPEWSLSAVCTLREDGFDHVMGVIQIVVQGNLESVPLLLPSRLFALIAHLTNRLASMLEYDGHVWLGDSLDQWVAKALDRVLLPLVLERDASKIFALAGPVFEQLGIVVKWVCKTFDKINQYRVGTTAKKPTVLQMVCRHLDAKRAEHKLDERIAIALVMAHQESLQMHSCMIVSDHQMRDAINCYHMLSVAPNVTDKFKTVEQCVVYSNFQLQESIQLGQSPVLMDLFVHDVKHRVECERMIWFEDRSVETFVIRVIDALNLNSSRWGVIFDRDVVSHLEQVFVVESVCPIIDTILMSEQIQAMMRQGNGMILGQLWRLVEHVKTGPVQLAQSFRAWMVQEMNRVVDACTLKGESCASLVQEAFALYERAQILVEESFSRNVHCAKAVKEVMDLFANVMLGPEKSVPFALVLASFCHDALSSKADAHDASRLQKDIEMTCRLYEYVLSKDVFIESIHVYLARRLLTGKSIGFDWERELILGIKRISGAFSVIKQEDMIKDFQASMMIFSSEMEARVLKYSSWPQIFREVNVHESIKQSVGAFCAHYESLDSFRMRKLTPQWLVGRVVLNVQVGGADSAVKEVVMSPIQASVVLLCAERQMSFEEFGRALNIPVKFVMDSVMPLLVDRPNSKRLLAVRAEGQRAAGERVKLTPASVVTINRQFVSASRRVVYDTVWVDATVKMDRVEENRDWEVRAALVKVMKERKTLVMELLIQQVCTMIHTFRPAPRNVKHNIEWLIQQDYFERDASDLSVLKYIA